MNELSKFYASTTELKKSSLDLEIFRNDQYRVSALVKNDSSVTIKDAKALMDLEEPSLKKLSEVIMECNECGRCDVKKFLVNRIILELRVIYCLGQHQRNLLKDLC